MKLLILWMTGVLGMHFITKNSWMSGTPGFPHFQMVFSSWYGLYEYWKTWRLCKKYGVVMPMCGSLQELKEQRLLLQETFDDE